MLHRLIASTDVFITNFPLPVRERLKIAAADLLAINPRLIYGSISAYGEAGEEARADRLRRHRLLGAHRPDGHGAGHAPTPSRCARCRAWAIIRPRPALYAAIVTALYRREKTGRGGVAQTSLLQNGLWANGCFVQNRLFGEHVAHRPPRTETPSALANHYRCRDGRWFLMALHNEARQLAGLPEGDRRRAPGQDPRFATQLGAARERTRR